MGAHIRVLQQGRGSDILLIHGSPGSIEDWLPVMQVLSRQFRVTAYDRPGHGYSSPPANGFGFEENAAAALALVESLQLRDVTVVGHSYGGPIALTMALRRPEIVRSVVVVDSALYEPSRAIEPMHRLLAAPGIGAGLAVLAGPTLAPARIRERIPAEFRNFAPPREFIEQRTEIWSQPKVMMALAHEVIGTRAALASLSPRYDEIACPLYLTGQAEDRFRRSNLERLHKQAPTAELFLLGGTGHYVQIQKVPELAGIIRRAASVPATRVPGG
jgi:pimeloyl-ACP methyl ester carboxylesterase